MVGSPPPRQGQLLKMDLDPTQGHERNGYRPVLVVSATLSDSHAGFCWVVPIITPKKGLPITERNQTARRLAGSWHPLVVAIKVHRLAGQTVFIGLCGNRSISGRHQRPSGQRAGCGINRPGPCQRLRGRGLPSACLSSLVSQWCYNNCNSCGAAYDETRKDN
ncbi:MAG: type II toxin-antitoxin system PemK/MazF family toxin [Deltaproteobacteria bacterium]|nr:type II toxin-antitoxin system PemK/MazF family toxin [Deltaproteobacteria bacterium]